MSANPQHHSFTVRTRRRHGKRGSSGYTVRIDPPLVVFSNGEDVEGIGWWAYHDAPRRTSKTDMGWFRYRQDAERSANQWRRGTGLMGCSCERCDPAHAGHRHHATRFDRLAQAVCG